MTPLAETIYDLLRRRVGRDDPRVTYAELARLCRDQHPAFETLNHRSKELYAALCEIGDLCRDRDLPPLPSLVVRADNRRPGDAYYQGMTVLTRGERLAAWQRDFDAVRQAAFPPLS